MGARHWTETELHYARSQHEAGVTLKQLARKLGRSWVAIGKKLYRDGAKLPAVKPKRKRPWSETDDLMAVRSHLRAEIAAARREAPALAAERRLYRGGWP